MRKFFKKKNCKEDSQNFLKDIKSQDSKKKNSVEI